VRCALGTSMFHASDPDIWQAIERARIDSEPA